MSKLWWNVTLYHMYSTELADIKIKKTAKYYACSESMNSHNMSFKLKIRYQNDQWWH